MEKKKKEVKLHSPTFSCRAVRRRCFSVSVWSAACRERCDWLLRRDGDAIHRVEPRSTLKMEMMQGLPRSI